MLRFARQRWGLPLYLPRAECLNYKSDFLFSAEMYNQAAEAAMEAMKGRLANKYYALAEEAMAMCEEEE